MRGNDRARSLLGARSPAWQAEADALIRGGRLLAARELLAARVRDGVAREHRASAANLAWRVSAPGIGIRLLNPIVRPTRHAPAEPSPRERAEYAACLVKLGALDEALGLLDEVDPAAAPQALLYRGFALVGSLDYRAALDPFRRYAAQPGIGRYARLVARVNLAAACVQEHRHVEAVALLRDVLHDTSLSRHALLHGNALQLAAECQLLGGDPARARDLLHRALDAMGPVGIYPFLARKLLALSALALEPASERARAGVAAIRGEAARLAHWESARDCDRYEALATGNRALFLKLYFGSPLAEFRRRIVAEMSPRDPLPDAYDRRLEGLDGRPPEGRGRRAVLDLASAEIDGKRRLVVGGVPHRLLAVLASDAYRPFNVPSLFARLFPDECWNPTSGPPRVHQAVRLLRAAVEGTPLVVTEKNGWYGVRALRPLLVRVSRASAPPAREAARLESLRRRFGGSTFTARDAALQLGCTGRQALRLLTWGLARDRVTKTGKRALARYAVR